MTNAFHRLLGYRHGPFLVAVTLAAAMVAPSLWLAPSLIIEVPSIVFHGTYLTMMALRMPRLTSVYLRDNAEKADEPAALIIIVTLLAVAVSIAALFLAVNGGRADGLGLALAFLAVITGWATIHTMAAVHYAHLYWRPETTQAGADNKGGLSFPETDAPNGWDFLYFAFVVGMTAQTSDIAITTTRMRRINLLHAVVSYLFNTVLVAAAVNAAVSLAG